MSQTTGAAETCRKCGGPLVEQDDYIAAQMVRRSLAAIPVAIVLCALWAPLFAFLRVAVGGGFGHVKGSIAAFILMLLLRKLVVGAMLGILIGVGVGIWRSAWGLFTGTVVGSIGGFFVAATYALPLRSEAQFRWDIVLTAVLAGLLGAATAVITDSVTAKRSAKYIGPELYEESSETAKQD
jgi:hypothetical protein